MRLYELDYGSARDVLQILKGLADKSGSSSELPFNSIKGIFKSFDYPIGNGGPESKELLLKIKNLIDPTGTIIADVTDKAAIVLATDKPTDNPDVAAEKGSSPSVDAMASSNAKTLTR
jgi:hypothetical protein